MGKIRKHKKKSGTATKSLDSIAATKSIDSIAATKPTDSIALDKRKQKQFSTKTKFTNKLKKDNTAPKSASNGVIRLTNIPHGFFEEQMQGYFSQFGKVLDIKVARSRKNAKPLGLAYVKFQYRGVARIVASSMNGYLMFNKIMRCKYIKAAKVNEITMFRNKIANAQSCPGVLKHRFTIDAYNRKRTEDEDHKRQSRLAEKMMKKEKMLNEMGLNLNLNVPEDKIYKKEKKLPNTNSIKSEQITPEESKKFNEAKDELANTIKAQLEEQKENSPEEEETDSETENEEDEEDVKARIILEVDESEDEIVIKTPPNAIKKVKKSTSAVLESQEDKAATKRKSAMKDPESLLKKGKLEIDPSAVTPPKIKTPKPKTTNSVTPQVSKQGKKLKNPKKLKKNAVLTSEKTPVLTNKKSKVAETNVATPGLTTPKIKRKLKIPQSA